MATPHVAGVVASLLSRTEEELSVSDINAIIQDAATNGKIVFESHPATDIHGGPFSTPNKLLHINCVKEAAPEEPPSSDSSNGSLVAMSAITMTLVILIILALLAFVVVKPCRDKVLGPTAAEQPVSKFTPPPTQEVYANSPGAAVSNYGYDQR